MSVRSSLTNAPADWVRAILDGRVGDEGRSSKTLLDDLTVWVLLLLLLRVVVVVVVLLTRTGVDVDVGADLHMPRRIPSKLFGVTRPGSFRRLRSSAE